MMTIREWLKNFFCSSPKQDLIPRTCPRCFYHFWSPPDVKNLELCCKCKVEYENEDKLKLEDIFSK